MFIFLEHAMTSRLTRPLTGLGSPRPISRRRFLAASSVALAGAPMFVRARNANEKLNIAVIGVADRGDRKSVV